MSKLKNLNVITTCKKCPSIKGDTFCNLDQKQIWKEDEMCPEGYRIRIHRGLEMCSKRYIVNENDPKIETIMEQVYELERLYEEKFPEIIQEAENVKIENKFPEYWTAHPDRIEAIDDNGTTAIPF